MNRGWKGDQYKKDSEHDLRWVKSHLTVSRKKLNNRTFAGKYKKREQRRTRKYIIDLKSIDSARKVRWDDNEWEERGSEWVWYGAIGFTEQEGVYGEHLINIAVPGRIISFSHSNCDQELLWVFMRKTFSKRNRSTARERSGESRWLERNEWEERGEWSGLRRG